MLIGLSVMNFVNRPFTEGVRIYAMGENGSADCTHVADSLATLIARCSKIVDGDVRTGGRVYFTNGGTYVQVSQ